MATRRVEVGLAAERRARQVEQTEWLGDIDPSLVEPSWTDETTGKTYKKAFALQNRCNFPSSLKAGDEFYFKIDSSGSKSCIVCMIYYPVPSKKIPITVIDSAAYQLIR